jgi:hypothetical protein
MRTEKATLDTDNITAQQNEEHKTQNMQASQAQASERPREHNFFVPS